MKRLVLVSNKLPITTVIKDKNIFLKSTVGGLATGLSSVYKQRNALWIGWLGIPTEKIKSQEKN